MYIEDKRWANFKKLGVDNVHAASANINMAASLIHPQTIILVIELHNVLT